jgi:hypothetical protein
MKFDRQMERRRHPTSAFRRLPRLSAAKSRFNQAAVREPVDLAASRPTRPRRGSGLRGSGSGLRDSSPWIPPLEVAAAEASGSSPRSGVGALGGAVVAGSGGGGAWGGGVIRGFGSWGGPWTGLGSGGVWWESRGRGRQEG